MNKNILEEHGPVTLAKRWWGKWMINTTVSEAIENKFAPPKMVETETAGRVGMPWKNTF